MRSLLTWLLALVTFGLHAQGQIEVYNGSVKLSSVSEEFLYFSFAEGDKLLFDFQETSGRGLKEFEVSEWPKSSRLLEYDKVKITGKGISIPKTAVYQFRFANRSITERVCKLRIWRVPASAATRNFKTEVGYKTVQDTAYYTVTDKVLTRTDTTIFNRAVVVTLNRQVDEDVAMQFVEFELPANTVGWSYHIGVNQGGQQAYQDAVQKSKNLKSSVLSTKTGYGPLAELAFKGTGNFSPAQAGEKVTYSICDAANVSLARQQKPFQSLRSNTVVSDFGAMKSPLTGKIYFCLFNENPSSRTEATVRVSAILINPIWEDGPVRKMLVQTKKVPILIR